MCDDDFMDYIGFATGGTGEFPGEDGDDDDDDDQRLVLLGKPVPGRALSMQYEITKDRFRLSLLYRFW